MTAAFPRHLTLGSRGRDVAVIKRALDQALQHQHDMNPAPIVGRGTLNAIDQFQEPRAIREDGYGLATHRALEHFFSPADRRVLAEVAAKYPAFPARHRRRVFATQYGGPHDPGTPGHHGYRGDDLDVETSSYAELSTNTTNGAHNDYRAIARAIGEHHPLPYETPIRLTYKGHVVVVYKRDVGFGGRGRDQKRGTPDDPVIDLWHVVADRIGHNGWDYVDIEVGRH